MKEHNLLAFVAMVAVGATIAAVAQQGASTSTATVSTPEVSASNEAGTVSVRWRMPPPDSAFVFETVRSLGDATFQDGLTRSFQRQAPADSAAMPTERRQIPGMKSVEKAKADFMIERNFADQMGTHALSVKMPANQAIGVLKAAFLVGDSRFKYQVIHFGFQKYQDKEVRADLLAFLAETFDGLDTMSKGEVMFSMFAMDARSPHTRVALDKAGALTGDGKVETHIRQAARDLLEYLKTGDAALLAKYNVAL
jgi:hypothetical protein